MAAFAPETIFFIGSFPITNTFLNTLLVDAVLITGAVTIGKNIKKIPGKFQNLVELIIDSFYELTESVAGKNAAKIFPWFMTFFLFILVANWSGLLPGAGSIGFKEPEHAVVSEHSTTTPSSETKKEEHAKPEERISLIRNATSELNVTLALAIISLIATHVLSIRAVGIKDYLSRFFSINPILLFVGILELISEFTKIVSLSFRLFGNIFAGEVVLATISSLFAFVFPLPFMFLEIIVGFVQALVFGMLTMVFMSVMMTPHHAEEHATNENSKH